MYSCAFSVMLSMMRTGPSRNPSSLGPVRIIDNMTLKAHEYIILLKGVEVARYELPPGCELATPVGKVDTPPEGRQTREAAFGMTGWWVPADQAERARRSGFTVVDAVSVLGTHLAEVMRRHAHELLSRQDAKKVLDRVAAEHPKQGILHAETAAPGGGGACASESAPRASFHPRLRHNPGSAGGFRPSHQKPDPSDRYMRRSLRRQVVKPYLNAAGRASSRIYSKHRWSKPWSPAVEHGEQNSHLDTRPNRDSRMCCGEST